MKIISVWSSKGGVGKTTLTLHIADCLSVIHNKKVMIYDADPQLSLFATVAASQDNFSFTVVNEMPSERPDCDVFIIDFRPAGISNNIQDPRCLTKDELTLLENSDVIISPTRASRLDLSSAKTIEKLNTEAKIVKVLSNYDKRSSDQKAVRTQLAADYEIMSYKTIYARTVNDYSTIYTRKSYNLYGVRQAKKEIEDILKNIL